jgi:hypothetical protein
MRLPTPRAITALLATASLLSAGVSQKTYDQPVASNETSQGRAKKRRVGMDIVELK